MADQPGIVTDILRLAMRRCKREAKKANKAKAKVERTRAAWGSSMHVILTKHPLIQPGASTV